MPRWQRRWIFRHRRQACATCGRCGDCGNCCPTRRRVRERRYRVRRPRQPVGCAARGDDRGPAARPAACTGGIVAASSRSGRGAASTLGNRDGRRCDRQCDERLFAAERSPSDRAAAARIARLRTARRTRPRRHGRRLSRLATELAAGRGGQADPARFAGFGRRSGPLSGRGRGGRAIAASAHRADLRSGELRGPVLLQYATRRG